MPSNKAQSTSIRIAQRVKRIPKGQPFSIRSFAEVGTRNAVYKAIALLTNRGQLERLHRGIYMRPKASLYVKRYRPSVWEVVRLIARQNRQTLQIHGANAVRMFGLSTQVPLVPIYYTSGPSRTYQFGKGEVRLIHAPPFVMQHAGTEVGTAISALFYLGKEGTTEECITAIQNALKPEDQITLMTCKMPRWMRRALELNDRKG
ncbi:DUF6088 family protein [Pseudomonas otitidis]|uniref:DUF6088 family protein n=1 Tax=Metapseudomonas otitidis TaxID=319939 RepID=UPI00244C59EF|nr:DUF6088 family protein [Pseudomonas otitidis]MDH1105149.1 DUF6088 family protein [Pseudomonas otitidis]MDH1157414.1 DUF6088 family protein [Pseudomonas otitidis]MDH1162919.1 DUF6088 family protein [Pseudomonas otitidis]